MMPAPAASVYWQFISLLAIEAAAMVGLCALLQWRIKSAIWRRTLWQICTLALAVLVVGELTGVGRGIVDRVSGFAAQKPGLGMEGNGLLSHRAAWPTVITVINAQGTQFSPTPIRWERENLRPSARVSQASNHISELAWTTPLPAGEGRGEGEATSPATASSASLIADSPWNQSAIWILGLIWFIGSAIFIIRVVLARILLELFRWRRQPVQDATVLHSAHQLARRMGISRRVRLVESPQLYGPITFGIFRPTVALPADFTQRFPAEEREAILAHELAHLGAHDPAWHLLADLVSAVIFWHPLAWWSRHQLKQASEAVADEASLLVHNGPATLAECLVALSVRRNQSQSLAWMGVAGNGFRSSLGRRVDRLLQMSDRIWRSPNRWHSSLVKLIGTVALVAMAMLCVAWATPPTALKQGETMKSMTQNWKNSLAAFVLMTWMNPSHQAAPVQEPLKAKPTTNTTRLAAREGAMGLDPETIRRLEPSRFEALADYTAMRKLMTNLVNLNESELKRVLPTSSPDPLLIELLQRYNQGEQELATISTDLTERHPKVVRVKNQLKTLDAQIKTRMSGILAGMKVRLKALQSDLEARKLALKDTQELGNAPANSPLEDFSLFDLQRRRIEAMANHAQLQELLQNLSQLKPGELRSALPTAQPQADTLLNDLLSRYYQVEQELAILSTDLGNSNPSVVRLETLLKKIDSQIDARIDGIMAGLKIKLESLKGDSDARTAALKAAIRQ